MDNVFAETEQVVFHPGMWYRELIFLTILSYKEDCFHTQIPSLFVLAVRIFTNFQSTVQYARFITTNETVTDVKRLTKDLSAITETLFAANTPAPVPESEGGYAHYQEKVEGRKVRSRSESFKDHFSQATLFWNSIERP